MKTRKAKRHPAEVQYVQYQNGRVQACAVDSGLATGYLSTVLFPQNITGF